MRPQAAYSCRAKAQPVPKLRVAFATLTALLCGCTTLDSSPSSQAVTVTGRGSTEDEARKSARQAALDKVVGALVDAETRIANGEVLEDIISASAGFVEEFTTLDSGITRDGARFVTARVVVRSNQLKQRLVQAQVLKGSADGESAVARELSNSANAAEIARFLEKNLRDYPARFLTARLVGDIQILSRGTDQWTAGLQVEVAVDESAWRRFAQLTEEALAVVASERWRWRPKEVRGDPAGVEYLHPVQGEPWTLVDSWFYGDVLENSAPSFSEIFAAKRRSVAWSGRWIAGLPGDSCIVMIPKALDWRSPVSSFVVPRTVMAEFARMSLRDVRLDLRLCDRSGTAIQDRQASLILGPSFLPDWNLGAALERAAGGSGLPASQAHLAGWIDVDQTSSRYQAARINESSFRMPDDGFGWSERLIAYIPQGMPMGLRLYAQRCVLKIAFAARPADIEQIKSVDLEIKTHGATATYAPELP